MSVDNQKNKCICMMTDWYPTKDNPYRGVFFKEQAFAMSEDFDFLVLHYSESRKGLPIIKQYTLEKVKEEKNTIEYNLHIELPSYVILYDILHNFYVKKIKKQQHIGIGKYVSKAYVRAKEKALKKAFDELTHHEIDVLYCVSAQTESNTVSSVSGILNKPYMVAEHGPFPWPGTVLKDIDYKAIENANGFLAISYDKIRQILIQNIKLPPTTYVGNMVDEESFALTQGGQGIKTFIVVAANSFYKNMSLMIRIFELLMKLTNIPFKLMLVGYGANKGYSENADAFEKNIRSTSFAKYVEFIPEIAHERIHELYERADAFVMTSIQEGMPVSALEAACCGLPIFSTMCGGVEDVVTEETGRIYRINDSESFAYGLKEFLENKISFEPEIIRNYIVEKFGKAAFIGNMKKAFTEAINNYEKVL